MSRILSKCKKYIIVFSFRVEAQVKFWRGSNSLGSISSKISSFKIFNSNQFLLNVSMELRIWKFISQSLIIFFSWKFVLSNPGLGSSGYDFSHFPALCGGIFSGQPSLFRGYKRFLSLEKWLYDDGRQSFVKPLFNRQFGMRN